MNAPPTTSSGRIRHRRRRRRGYVLVLVLGVLVLASVLLVGIGRVSMKHAADARLAADDLQRRWGAASCRQALLPIAEQLLDAEEARAGAAVPAVSATLRLNGQTFDLTFADEQAKADVNALIAGSDVPTAEAALRRSLQGYGLADRIRLRPGGDAPGATSSRPPVGSLGQVFDDVPPEVWLRPPAGGGPAPADLITCWGGGRLNLRRVSEPALRLAVGQSLTTIEIRRLIDARDDIYYRTREPGVMHKPEAGGPRSPFRQAIDAANLVGPTRRATSAFTDGSTRHSLRIAVGNGGQRRVTFAVLDTTDVDRPVWVVQSW